MKVDEVIKDGPSDKAGMNIRPGMIIESIDRESIAPDKDLPQFLNRKAGKKTLVGVADGIRWGVPHEGVKDTTTGRYLEGHQTEPDIKVRNACDVISKGKDQQLEAAVAALLKEVRSGTTSTAPPVAPPPAVRDPR